MNVFRACGLVISSLLASAAAEAAPCTFSPAAIVPVKISGAIADLLFDDDCKRLYATNTDFNRVEVYDLTGPGLMTSAQVGTAPTDMDLSPDGATLYVVNSGSTYVSVVGTVQRAETGRITLPALGGEVEKPYGLAVARSGMVLISTDHFASHIYQYTDAGGLTLRKDLSLQTLSQSNLLTASGDRGVIILTAAGISSGAVYRFDVAANAYTAQRNLNSYVDQVAVDATGAQIVAGGSLLDSSLNVIAGLPYSSRSPLGADGKVAYQQDTDVVKTYDLGTFLLKNTAAVPGATLGGAIATSRDGSLIAVRTATGFSILTPALAALPAPTIVRAVVRSSAQATAQSFLRFYNSGTTEGAVKVTLTHPDSGAVLVQWTSPSIAPGAAPQFPITTIEAAATQSFTKPSSYVALVDSNGVKGTMAQVLWRPSDGTLTNLSTCDSGVSAVSGRAVNVHSQIIGNNFPSSLVVDNTGTVSTAVDLSIYDAATGLLLGSMRTAAIPAAGALTLSMGEIEQHVPALPASGAAHYVVKMAQPGYIQHLVNNRRVGVITDMSTVCTLP